MRPSDVGYFGITIIVEGNKSVLNLNNEAGGLRFQRIPPNENRGRVHTSTVTVSVIGDEIKSNPIYDLISDEHFYSEWYSGTGKGGQKRNKSQSCIRLYHLPSGLVESRQGRSRSNNYKDAKNGLLLKLEEAKNSSNHSDKNIIKSSQIGSGMRGDKIRTMRFQNDLVTDHRTGGTITAKKYMNGYMDLLWV